MNDKLIELKNRLLTRFLNENDELKAENDTLKFALNNVQVKLDEVRPDNRHDNKVCDDYDDDLIKECKELQVENAKLKDNNIKLEDKLNNSKSHK